MTDWRLPAVQVGPAAEAGNLPLPQAKAGDPPQGKRTTPDQRKCRGRGSLSPEPGYAQPLTLPGAPLPSANVPGPTSGVGAGVGQFL